MLRFFRLNDPYRLLFVFMTVITLGIKSEFENPGISVPEFNGVLVGEMMADGKSMYSEVWHSLAPLTAFVQFFHDVLFDRSILARHITVLVLIFIQAAWFGVILINNRAFNESNYLPSFILAVIFFFSLDTISLTGDILGTTLLLLALNNLLKEIEFKRPRDETIHNLGFYLGLASISVFSYTVFFIGIAFLLFIFTRVEVRRFSLFIVGFLLPHLAMNLWYYWNDELDLLWQNFYVANLNFSPLKFVSAQSLLILTGIPILYFLISLIMMRRDARLTKYQSQIAQLMFMWLVLGLLEAYLNPMRSPQALLVCAPPFAYYVNHYFYLIKRKWIAETMAWAFVIGVLGTASVSSRNNMNIVDYGRLYMGSPQQNQATGKKILVMSSDLHPYLNNRTSTYFLDWRLFQAVFTEPDVYQHVVVVADAFETDPPDVIFDPNDIFSGMLKYIPSIRQQYVRSGDDYIRVQ